jgi:hypothetical protein
VGHDPLARHGPCVRPRRRGRARLGHTGVVVGKTIAGYAMRTFTPVVPRVVRAEVVAHGEPGEVVQGEIVPG